MEIQRNKCSLEDHSQIDAIIYCQECRIFMCNKCEKSHSALFKKHSQYKLDKNIKDIFTGFCKEKNHNNELKYFCKSHNELCCAACLSKIKDKKYGQHFNCDVCTITDIENEKRTKLIINIEQLEHLQNNLEESINNLNQSLQTINDKKENLKTKIQEIFTNFRNILNGIEDELLSEIDNLYFKDNIIKDCEKLPKKIQESLERGKIINNMWDNNKLNILINDCLKIENNIRELNIINESITKCNSVNYNVKFSPTDNGINLFSQEIKNFGKIYTAYNFKFKKCPLNLIEKKKFEITGETGNIITKIGEDYNTGSICKKELDKTIEG